MKTLLEDFLKDIQYEAKKNAKDENYPHPLADIKEFSSRFQGLIDDMGKIENDSFNEKERELDEKEEDLDRKEDDLYTKECELEEKENKLNEKEEDLEKMKEELEEKQKEIDKKLNQK